ncbi:MAG: NAD(P)/FAD-dependent oxidoreductase [Acidobacteriota bacterium]|nr:NAD(P)/FAD-dependent oxidoreductase [Acidobacteriota bacterium]
MKKQFDLIAIGTGSAASSTASRCRAAGWNVAIIDSLPFGGTCALRGCDPKKVLVGAADLMDWNRRMKGKGVQANDARIDWPALISFKRTFTDPVPPAREKGFADAGIAVFHGRAQFTGPRTVRVNDDELEGRYLMIGAGQKPAELKIPGAQHLLTSDLFLNLDRLPQRVLFIGGGYIGFEFAHVAARAGAQATILHRGPRPLPRFEPDLVDWLVEHTRAIGIDVQLGTEADVVEKSGSAFLIKGSAGSRERAFEADLVVHSAGRVPDIDDLNLEAAGVERDGRGVLVNEFLQSPSNPSVYAAGDAAASGGPSLTPVAGYEGRVVAENLLEGNHRKPEYRGIPTVVFSIPPLASVGLSEREARDRGLKFRARTGMTANWYASRRIGETISGFKTLIEEGTGQVLGAHLLGAHAEEVINLFALAMRSGLPAAALKEMIYAYPTNASNLPYML